MKLREFLTLTATSPTPALRRAIAGALTVETPRTPEAYSRFYRRVTTELGGGTAPHDAARPA